MKILYHTLHDRVREDSIILMILPISIGINLIYESYIEIHDINVGRYHF